MKRNNMLSLATMLGLLFVFCAAFAAEVPAQRNRNTDCAGKMLIASDTLMAEKRCRNAKLPIRQKRQIEAEMRRLASFFNGTWELVARSVSNEKTGGKTVLVPNEGRMVYNLKPNGTEVAGEFLIMEGGVGSNVISGGIPNGDPYILYAHNEVLFQGGFEEGAIGPNNGGMMSFISTRSSKQTREIVITEQLTMEIQGSYGSFRKLTAFKQASKELPKYVMKGKGANATFVALDDFAALTGTEGDDADNFDIIELSDNVMILGISKKGILDVWRKSSNAVTMNNLPLRRAWENIKRSGAPLKPTFKVER